METVGHVERKDSLRWNEDDGWSFGFNNGEGFALSADPFELVSLRCSVNVIVGSSVWAVLRDYLI